MTILRINSTYIRALSEILTLCKTGLDICFRNIGEGIMKSVATSFSTVVFSSLMAISLSACGPKHEPVKPDAQQQASLTRLHKNCIAASPGKKGEMRNLARLRKKQAIFSCDEMKQICEQDYANDMCKGMMTVASVENAVEKACRKNERASRSPACSKLTRPCNVKGFESPECTSVIARYNK